MRDSQGASSVGHTASRVVVITGATSGIGQIAAIELARRGVQLVLPARNRRRAEETVAQILHAAPGAEPVIVDGDFSDLASTRAVATRILQRYPRIDVLINNAGVHTMSQRTTVDGFSEMMTVNYLAPWLLTAMLLPALRDAPSARVVTVASEASRRHGTVGVESDLVDTTPFSARQSSPRYGKTKLFDIMFTLELDSRLHNSTVSALCLDPGFNRTGLGRDLRFAAALEWALRALNIGDPQRGADLIVRVATEDGLPSGGYFSGRDGQLIAPIAPADDPLVREELWNATEKLLAGKGYGTDWHSCAPPLG